MDNVFRSAGVWLVWLVALFLLTGCLATKSPEKWAAIKDIRVAEEGTKQEFLKTKKAELEVESEKAPSVSIDSKDEMLIYVLGQAIQALAGRDKKPDHYGLNLQTTPFPKSDIAEIIEATGDAAVKVGNTPTALVLGTGWAVGSVARDGFEAAGDRYVAGGSIQSSGNTENLSVTGDRNETDIGRDANPSTEDDHSYNDDHSTDDHSNTDQVE